MPIISILGSSSITLRKENILVLNTCSSLTIYVVAVESPNRWYNVHDWNYKYVVDSTNKFKKIYLSNNTVSRAFNKI